MNSSIFPFITESTPETPSFRFRLEVEYTMPRFVLGMPPSEVTVPYALAVVAAIVLVGMLSVVTVGAVGWRRSPMMNVQPFALVAVMVMVSATE